MEGLKMSPAPKVEKQPFTEDRNGKLESVAEIVVGLGKGIEEQALERLRESPVYEGLSERRF